MTREEALELFDLPDTATNETVLQKYRELYSEYSLRLTNAPTSHLRKIYSQNIQKIEEAFKFLCPGVDVDESQFLPTDKPVFAGSGKSFYDGISVSQNTQGRETTPKDKNGTSLKRRLLRINFLAFASLIMFSVGVFAIIMFFKRESVIGHQETIIEKLKQDTMALKIKLKAFNDQGNLIIRNNYIGIITITWIMAIYSENNLPKCYFKNLKIQIRPGELKQFSDPVENWKGQVVFYSFYFETDTETAHIQGHVNGIWAQDQINNVILIPPNSGER